jgi:opacity protein-like surface antigen
MKKIIALFSLLAVASLPVSSSAAPAEAPSNPILSYDRFDIGYAHTFFDDSGVDDASALSTGLALSPADNFYFELGYDYTEVEAFSIDIKSHSLTYGAGVYQPLTDLTHLVGRFGGIYNNADADGFQSEDDNGYYLGAEVRTSINDELEIAGSVTYANTNDTDGSWVYGLAGIVPTCQGFGIRTLAEIDDDSNLRLTGGIRVGF